MYRQGRGSKGGCSGARPGVNRDASRSETRERRQLRKKLHRGGAVLLADRVAVGREPERREHFVAQLAQSFALTPIRGHGTWANGDGRGMRLTLVVAHRLIDLVVKVVLDAKLRPSRSCADIGRVRASATDANDGSSVKTAWPASRPRELNGCQGSRLPM